jgi:hypothetical protein
MGSAINNGSGMRAENSVLRETTNHEKHTSSRAIIAGAALAVKTLRPQAKIIAVEAEHVASFSTALSAGKPTPIRMETTLADGLAIPQVGANGFEIASSRVDKTVTVTEEQIALAILRIVELEKVLLKEQGQRHSPPVFPGSFRNSPESGSSWFFPAATSIRTYSVA